MKEENIYLSVYSFILNSCNKYFMLSQYAMSQINQIKTAEDNVLSRHLDITFPLFTLLFTG